MEEFAEQLLVQAEILYLRAHGWKPQDARMEWWLPPADYYWEQKRSLRHGREHAVNSQKAALRDARNLGKKPRLLRLAEFIESIPNERWRVLFPRHPLCRRQD